MTQPKDSGGITAKQAETLEKLSLKEKTGKALTEKQVLEKERLIQKRDFKPEFDISVGAKTYVRSLVKQIVLHYNIEADSKQTAKGDFCEVDSIELYNYIHFTNHKKNERSESNDWIIGTCDIDCPISDFIKDAKTSWSKETFPLIESDIDSAALKQYEWQGRGYMMLYDRSNFEVFWTLVSTPYQLLIYEKNKKLHFVDDIEEEIRMTSVKFKRCLEKENEIIYRVKECRKYAIWYYNQIIKKHTG